MTITIENDVLPSWDLSDLYSTPNSPEFKNDIAKAKDLCLEFAKNYKGKVTKLNAKELYLAIKKYEEISDIFAKFGAYAFLKYAQDQSNPENSSFYQNTSETINDIVEPTIFFTLELNQISEESLSAMLNEQELSFYRPWLTDLRVEKPYQLSEKEETILHQKYITSRQSWVKLFDESQADMRFDFDDKQLTSQEIFQHISHADRQVREKAAKSIEVQFEKHVKLYATITNVVAKDKQINDNMRGFKSPISSRNLANLVEDEVVDNLINVVKSNYQATSHRYYAIKAKLLGLDKMEYWDRNAPLTTVEERYIPWAEAVQITLDSYRAFSPEMAEIGQKFFDNNWVDAAMRPGKYSGAFAHHTAAKIHPYILVNYQGKSRDVMTLAHELGHGIHMYLSAQQGELMCGTPLTLAETASIFGEQVVFQNLLERETDPAIKRSILAHKIDDTLSTIVRQIAFTDFELAVHDARKNGEISIDALNAFWIESQKESFGPIFEIRENYKYFWQYVSHFIHVPFYVYSYAFACCLVNSLYAQYQSGSPKFVELYTQALAAGGTKRYGELLKGFNLSAHNKEFWQSGMDVVINLIDQLEASL